MRIVIVAVVLVMTLGNSIGFLSGLWGTRPGEVYLGTTHYWQDYFFYVSQFFQGANGQWLTLNRYTSEYTSPSILFWPNVLLGKLGGLVGFTPDGSYNISVMVLSFAVLVTLSILMRHAYPKDNTKALMGFLLATLSTSLINRIWVNGQPMWYPFELWKTPHFALDRLGAVPHQTLQTLLFLLAMIAEKPFALLLILVFLATLNPVLSALFLIAAWVSAPRAFRRLIPATVGVALATWYYLVLSNQQPHIQSKLWEAADQVRTTPAFMLLSIGPMSALGAIGAWSVRKRVRPIHLFSIVLLVISYTLYFSPIPQLLGVSNSRVLFPAMYAAWGVLAVEGMFFGKKTYVVFFLFILLTIPTLKWEIKRKLTVKPQERIPLLYLPQSDYQAFAYLRNQRPYDDIVLANPASHMDALVPAFTGHTGWSGHPFATIENDKKRAEASRFFTRQVGKTEAKQWLGDHNIRFVVFTVFDGDIARFREAYPFLTERFTSGGTTVWSL